MSKNLDRTIDSLKDDIVRTTQELVQIKSVQEKAVEGMPFGRGVNRALTYTLNLCDSFGFKTKNVDNYAGHAEMGEGDEIFAILCHLDVVPEGSNWTYPPYAAEIHDGKIYGRGTIDDKGPAVAALYAMKAVKDSGQKLNKRVRIIFGTNEESGWEGIDYYLAREDTPDYAFTPDADFPVIYAEKGILHMEVTREFSPATEKTDITILSIKGGNAPNMVPDYCEAILESKNKNYLAKELKGFVEKTGYDLELENKGDKIIIKSQGKSAHGSCPEDGQNAISQLLVFLGTLALPEDELTEFIQIYREKIGMKYNGELLGCNFTDDVSGKLTFNVGMIEADNESGEFIVDIRYPVTYKKEDITEILKKEFSIPGFNLHEKEHIQPLHVDKDNPLVLKLMQVYRDITGDDSEPIAIGGGTYARALDNAVAFGPLFPGQPELAHQKDEFIAIDDLLKSVKIYAHAIVQLAGADISNS